jgi:hypothetical protein
MNLHIFNPSHDLALASGKADYVAPHKVRLLESDLDFLPSLWAEDDDMILVDNIERAKRTFFDIRNKIAALRGNNHFALEPHFVSEKELEAVFLDTTALTICPWGWNLSLKHFLLSINKSFEKIIFEDNRLSMMRELSSRRFASTVILPKLVEDCSHFVGKSVYFTNDADNLMDYMECHGGSFVLKAPWSCSGRGIRYVPETAFHDSYLLGWCRNIICQQGGIIVEPFYNKIVDFGMEFMSDEDGSVEYLGLSIFKTVNGYYTGSLISDEVSKSHVLSRYIDITLLSDIRSNIISLVTPHFNGVYSGPFGVDMMIVSKNNHFYVHPCVEINLRRTMGHVALKLSTVYKLRSSIMSVVYTDKFQLQISHTRIN